MKVNESIGESGKILVLKAALLRLQKLWKSKGVKLYTYKESTLFKNTAENIYNIAHKLYLAHIYRRVVCIVRGGEKMIF